MEKKIIYSGTHRSFPLSFKLFKRHKVSIIALFRFNKNCWYTLDNMHTNKLFGISTSLWPWKRNNKWEAGHKRNSIRLAWAATSDEGIINLYVYSYSDGIRSIDFIGKIETGKYYIANLTINKVGHNLYRSSISVKRSDMNTESLLLGEDNSLENSYIYSWANIASNSNIWYQLNPYFGGKPKAPHNMIIDLKLTYL